MMPSNVGPGTLKAIVLSLPATAGGPATVSLTDLTGTIRWEAAIAPGGSISWSDLRGWPIGAAATEGVASPLRPGGAGWSVAASGGGAAALVVTFDVPGGTT